MDGTAFLARVEEYHKAGWRLALINATSLMPSDELAQGAFDVVWAFAKETEFEYLRERVMPGEEVPSISASYGASFLYENEIRELFGINVTGIANEPLGFTPAIFNSSSCADSVGFTTDTVRILRSGLTAAITSSG